MRCATRTASAQLAAESALHLAPRLRDFGVRKRTKFREKTRERVENCVTFCLISARTRTGGRCKTTRHPPYSTHLYAAVFLVKMCNPNTGSAQAMIMTIAAVMSPPSGLAADALTPNAIKRAPRPQAIRAKMRATKLLLRPLNAEAACPWWERSSKQASHNRLPGVIVGFVL